PAATAGESPGPGGDRRREEVRAASRLSASTRRRVLRGDWHRSTGCRTVSCRTPFDARVMTSTGPTMQGHTMRRSRKIPRRLFGTTLVVAAFLALAGTTQADTPADSAPVPLLWKVSDDNNSLYLLGAFHLLKPGDYPLSRDVDAAFADAEKLVFEIPPEELGSDRKSTRLNSS